MEVLTKNNIPLSEGEVIHQKRMLEKVINGIPSGAAVSLEGPPIYLNAIWSDTHDMGYNLLLSSAMEGLSSRGNSLEHSVLIDDYTVPSQVPPEEYLSRIEPPVDRVLKEGSFVPAGKELIGSIGRNRVNRVDGRAVSLMTQSGRVSCAVLDAAFQETKEADFNIVIHPIEFLREQEEMRAVLLAARGTLPATFINIFFKGKSINRVYQTLPKGESKREGLL